METHKSLLKLEYWHMQTVAAVSPRFANPNVFRLGAPVFFDNRPFTVSGSQTLASVSEQMFNVAPCLIALSQTGVQVNPVLIGVSPSPFLPPFLNIAALMLL